MQTQFQRRWERDGKSALYLPRYVSRPHRRIGASFNHVQPGIFGGAASTNTFAMVLTSNPKLGSVVCCSISVGSAAGATILTLQDTNGNAYTVTPASPTTFNATTGGQVFPAYLLSAPANADKTVTVTMTATVNAILAQIDEFQPSNPAVFNADAVATSTGTVISGPSVSVSGPRNLVYAGVTATGTLTPQSPWVSEAGTGIEWLNSVDIATACAWVSDTSGLWNSIGMSFSAVGPSRTKSYFFGSIA